jgi:hypothetical protein
MVPELGKLQESARYPAQATETSRATARVISPAPASLPEESRGSPPERLEPAAVWPVATGWVAAMGSAGARASGLAEARASEWATAAPTRG